MCFKFESDLKNTPGISNPPIVVNIPNKLKCMQPGAALGQVPGVPHNFEIHLKEYDLRLTLFEKVLELVNRYSKQGLCSCLLCTHTY